MPHLLTRDNVTLATAVLALLVSALAVAYTHLQLRLAKQVRREQSEPYVIVDIAPRSPTSSMICLSITNSGPTMARDVQLYVSPPLRSSLGTEYEQALAGVIARKIKSIPPGRTIIYNLDVAFNVLDPTHGLPLVYTFRVEATGPFGAVEPLEYVVDLSVWQYSAYNRETVEGQLTEIAQSVKKIANKGTWTVVTRPSRQGIQQPQPASSSSDDDSAPPATPAP
ncbi:hypothetical protein ACIRPX_16075 [Streptomyces sp. NPDC101225]|uniref:hypothetical protein n=1 Tax=Streptomyces sp. NPDC101225 TaxID=3366135 RepID=UPI003829B233